MVLRRFLFVARRFHKGYRYHWRSGLISAPPHGGPLLVVYLDEVRDG
jgi:hypothetical protein